MKTETNDNDSREPEWTADKNSQRPRTYLNNDGQPVMETVHDRIERVRHNTEREAELVDELTELVLNRLQAEGIPEQYGLEINREGHEKDERWASPIAEVNADERKADNAE